MGSSIGPSPRSTRGERDSGYMDSGEEVQRLRLRRSRSPLRPSPPFLLWPPLKRKDVTSRDVIPHTRPASNGPPSTPPLPPPPQTIFFHFNSNYSAPSNRIVRSQRDNCRPGIIKTDVSLPPSLFSPLSFFLFLFLFSFFFPLPSFSAQPPEQGGGGGKVCAIPRVHISFGFSCAEPQLTRMISRCHADQGCAGVTFLNKLILEREASARPTPFIINLFYY